MTPIPESTRLRSAALAALGGAAVLWGGIAAAAQPPAPQSQAAAPAANVVYRCETKGGKVQFSDAPCPAGSRASAWSRPAAAPGIVATGGARPGPAPHTVLAGQPEPVLAGPSEPWVVCRQRGGEFDAAARVCRLPPDTVQHMFLAD